MSIVRVIQSFVHTLSADRELPHGFAPPAAFERLYRVREDPWDVRHSPFAQARYLEKHALIFEAGRRSSAAVR